MSIRRPTPGDLFRIARLPAGLEDFPYADSNVGKLVRFVAHSLYRLADTDHPDGAETWVIALAEPGIAWTEQRDGTFTKREVPEGTRLEVPAYCLKREEEQ